MKHPALSLFLLAAWLHATAVFAAETVELSPDITTDLGGEVLGPEETGEDDLAGTVTFTGPGLTLPIGTNLNGFHRFDDGDTLFSLDTTVSVQGVVATPADVVRVSGGVPSLEFDGSAEGVPAGTQIDALSVTPVGDLVLSFDVTVQLDGTTFADEDLVRIHAGTGDASLFFAPSSAGIDPALDLDAVYVLSNADVLVSFDGTGIAGGVTFSDEDLLEIDATGSLGEIGLEYDGSVQYASLGPTDLDAVHVVEADSDGDGLLDRGDNCVNVPNPSQADANAFEDDDTSLPGVQHYGDACDADLDEDGLVAPNDFFGVFRPCIGLSVASAPQCAEADFNGDGLVAPNDFFAVFRPSIGGPPGPGVTE